MGNEKIIPQETWLERVGSPLLDLAKSIGLESELISGEKLWGLRLEESIQGSRLALASSSEELLQKLASSYGESLTFLLLRGESTQWNFSDGPNGENLEKLRALVADDRSLTIRLAINKRDLLLPHFTDSEETAFYLFFFTTRLSAHLESNLTQVEKSFWPGVKQTKSIVFVGDEDFYLRGNHLAIYGGQHASQWQAYETPVQPQKSTSGSEPAEINFASAERMYDLCRQSIRWQDIQLDRLTPLHLKIENSSATESHGRIPSELVNILALQRCLLVLLYTADTSIGKDGAYWSIYQRGQTQVRVDWPHVREYVRRPNLDSACEENSLQLLSVVEWSYNLAWPDSRLLMAQGQIAEELRDRDKGTAFEALLRAGERLGKDLRSRWKDFIGKKLDGYSEQEHNLEEDVAKVVEAYDSQIGTMTKALNENGLAAGAAVLGSFLGAFYKDPFDANLFSGGLIIYGIYVLVFPLALGMSHQWGSFKALEEEFASRCARVKLRLDEEKVNQVIASSRLAANRSRFKSWFYVTFLVYVLLGSTALTSAFKVTPKIVAASQAPTPRPTIASTSTPGATAIATPTDHKLTTKPGPSKNR